MQKVLKGFKLILKKDGFAYIIVPNLIEVMRYAIDNGLDLCDQLYISTTGQSILPLDVIYGYGKQIESSGEDFFCHKTGFSSKTLKLQLDNSDFKQVYIKEYGFVISSIAFVLEPSEDAKKLFGLD